MPGEPFHRPVVTPVEANLKVALRGPFPMPAPGGDSGW